MTEAKPAPNDRLHNERLRRGWSQQDVADKVGSTPVNVSRWERGLTLPGPYLRQKLCELYDKSPEELGLVPEAAHVEKTATTEASEPPGTSTRTPPTSFWNVPYNRNLLFTGREDILAHLHRTLINDERPVALAQPQAISGLGGIGKTQTAIEYAYRYRNHYESVLWARADSADLLTSDFLLMAALLNLPQRSEQDQSVVVKAVMHWFDTHERWLLILDNADQLETASEFIPPAGKGHVLLTTRAHSTGTLAERVELETMGVEEGIVFLLRRAHLLKGSHFSLQELPEAMRSQAQAIVEAVDGLPLALDQAGAYIDETGCTLSDYLTFYRSRRARLLRMRGLHATGHPEPVATTWSLSFDKVARANPAAADLLRLCAFLHPDEIPEAMITGGASELGPVLGPVEQDELDWNEAIGELRRYSLVKRDPEAKILNMHRLVQVVIRDAMNKEEEKLWAERVLKMVSKAYPEVNFEVWPTCQQYLPHARICAQLIEQWNITGMEAANLLSKVGEYLNAREQYRDAEKLFKRSLDISKSLLEEDAPFVVDCVSALASVYYEQGKYPDAEQMYLRALGIREKTLDPLHPKIAESLNGLGELYWQWTKYAQAEEVLKRALQIRQQALGPDHPDVAQSLNNLALIYLYQGDNGDAEPLFEQAAVISEKALGARHPTTLIIMNNVGITYNRLGKYAQAEDMLLDIHKRREELEHVVGPRPFDMGQSLYNLGLLYAEIGKFSLAETLYRQALEKWEQVGGPDHPRIPSILNSLGGVHRVQGKLTEAASFYERGLALREQVVGTEAVDIEVANCLSGLAEVGRAQGNYVEAARLNERALLMREQMAGPESLHVAQSLNGLASLSYDMGKYEEAEPLFQRALSIRERKLGTIHPYVALTLSGLARLYVAQSRYSEAESLFQRALAIQEQSLEPDHPHRVETLENYSELLRRMNREGEASALAARSKAMRAKQA